MEKEPIELEEVRIQLKRFEESLGDPAGLPSTALEQRDGGICRRRL